jgi:hypothetical protein
VAFLITWSIYLDLVGRILVSWELDTMSPADAVFSYCRLVWMSQTNVSVVLLDPGINGTASLPNVNLATFSCTRLEFSVPGRDKTDCNNYRGISLLSTSYEILSNILLSRLIPYAEEIIGDHQCGFRRNRSTTNQIFYIRQTLEKKWEYNGTVHQLFIYFKKAYDSVKREALYNILIECEIYRKLVGLIKM